MPDRADPISGKADLPAGDALQGRIEINKEQRNGHHRH
jgi:hypothetical protein